MNKILGNFEAILILNFYADFFFSESPLKFKRLSFHHKLS